MDIYGEIVLDHFKHPRHGELLGSFTHAGDDANIVCGDKVRITMRTDDDGVIREFGFKGEGCAISVASTSLLGEKIIGMKLADVLEMNDERILELLGIPISPGRMKCALLGFNCIKNSLQS